MPWNYRIVRHVVTAPHLTAGEDISYGIHEAYYDDNGKVWSITADAVGIVGDSVQELQEVRIQMLAAFKQPVLDASSVPEPGAINPTQRKQRRKQA